jgi:hypothetical protein
MAIGTAAAISIGVSAAGAGLSFAQAAREKKSQKAAEATANQFMSDARKKLEVNYMDALAINKEPYERYSEAMLAAGAQSMLAAKEGSQRGSAAMAGRVMAQQQESQAKVRDALNEDIFNLESKKLTEDSRLRDVGANLDLAEVTGAQKAAADAERNRRAAIQQGIKGSTDALTGLVELPGLYPNTRVVKGRRV